MTPRNEGRTFLDLLVSWCCIRECTLGRPFGVPTPASAIAAGRCSATATADETWTVCPPKTAFCLKFDGRGVSVPEGQYGMIQINAVGRLPLKKMAHGI